MERIIPEEKVIFTSNRYPGASIADLTEPEKTILVKDILRRVKEFYKNPENQKKFEEWYFERYGKPYEGN